MREIKFRMWDKVSNKYFTDQEQVLECLKQQVTGIYDHCAEGAVFEQFTGFHDINGKEIYENDIIKMVYIHDEGGGWKSNSRELGKVYFDTYWGVKFDCVDFTQRVAESWKLKASTFRDACDVEVIGNIHENPKLLKAKK